MFKCVLIWLLFMFGTHVFLPMECFTTNSQGSRFLGGVPQTSENPHVL